MKKVLFVFLQLLYINAIAQQKAMFSQYMFNPLVINPAYSAVDESLNITSVARQQWTGFKGAPNTQTLSLHTPFRQSDTYIGFIAFRDQIGEAITETGGFLTFTQRVKLSNKTYLSFGVNGGLSKYMADYSSMGTVIDMNDDPAFKDLDGMRINMGGGIMLFSNKFYIGLSSPFLFISDYSAASTRKYAPQFMLQSGYIVNWADNLKVKPNMLIKYISGSPVQVDLNLNFLLNETLWIGASYRTMDSIDFLAEILLSKKISFGYSYDFAITKLSGAQNGSHEVMLNIRLPVAGREFIGCYY